jgi:hypothetical protein
MKLVEKGKLYSHRDFSNAELAKHTFGKNGLPPLHAVGSAHPTKRAQVVADAIMARAPSRDRYGIEQVLRRGINSEVDILAVEHEVDQANLDE